VVNILFHKVNDQLAKKMPRCQIEETISRKSDNFLIFFRKKDHFLFHEILPQSLEKTPNFVKNIAKTNLTKIILLYRY